MNQALKFANKHARSTNLLKNSTPCSYKRIISLWVIGVTPGGFIVSGFLSFGLSCCCLFGDWIPVRNSKTWL